MVRRQVTKTWVTGAMALLLAGWGGAISAGTLRIPDALPLPRAAESPGQVIFNHVSHVDADKPACTACHPREFRILKATKRAPIRHADMEKGKQCGSCHDGKKAFAMDDCTTCHTS